MADWWTQASSGYAGAAVGILGSLMGMYGGLAGTLAPKGLAKRFVLGVHLFWIVAGTTLLIAGITAILLSQPRHVWFPLLLGGFILSVLATALFPVILLRYRQADERKLQAQQFRTL